MRRCRSPPRRALDAELKNLELRWRVVGQAKLKGVRVLFDDMDEGNGLLHDSGPKKMRGARYRVPVALEHGKAYRWRVQLVLADAKARGSLCG